LNLPSFHIPELAWTALATHYVGELVRRPSPRGPNPLFRTAGFPRRCPSRGALGKGRTGHSSIDWGHWARYGKVRPNLLERGGPLPGSPQEGHAWGRPRPLLSRRVRSRALPSAGPAFALLLRWGALLGPEHYGFLWLSPGIVGPGGSHRFLWRLGPDT